MKNIDYIKILFTIAWADSKIQKEEAELLNEVIQYFKFNKEEHNVIKSWFSNPLSIDDIKDIDFNEWTLEQKKFILFLAISVAKIDGIYTSDEKDFIIKLEKLLNLVKYSFDDFKKDIKEDNQIFA